MGPWDQMIVPGDLEDSCNIVGSILHYEWNAYRSIVTFEVTVTSTLKITVKGKLIVKLIVP